MTFTDVSSPIDLRLMSDAVEWERTAMQRPFREDFFAAFIAQLINLGQPNLKILELGSGPGFLAQRVLSALPAASMTLLDFSPAMHELARSRLLSQIERVEFVERSFKGAGWETDLGQYDAVVTNQAVHELRHKRYAEALHRQVKPLLRKNGIYLVGDHYAGEGAMQNDQLYMNLGEQRASLETAGFKVEEILIKGGRALYLAR